MPDDESPENANGDGETASAATAAVPPAQSEAEITLSSIRDAEREVTKRAAATEEARLKHKSLKTAWEASVDDLQRLIRASTEELPLFDQKPEAPADDWREVRVDTLGLPEGIVGALEEAALATIGKLADWTNLRGARLIDIDGIGEAKAEKIEKALEEFWAARKAEAPAETNGAPPDDGWRLDNVGQLDMDNRLWMALTDAGLDTCGQLADAIQSGDHPLDLDNASLDTIAQALAVHRGRRGRKTAGAA